ncbi:hypothetical protein [Bradyrhizobium sp. ARR65]|uniref:hypothetical protein n=1 Tax=Bradyrhizobium sp. ARR65 TaxID=1040989 RepID=UPI000463E8EA|nr:hypothetical protein [Bradyrhizobium sp. ARR65]
MHQHPCRPAACGARSFAWNPDSPFTEIQLPGGKFRGFSASATTYAIDGTTPSDMSGAARPVLPPAPRGQPGESGEWIVHVERSGKGVLGWVHDETGDAPGQGLKSMSLTVSDDDGLSWRRLGQIITGTEPIIEGRITGEGDCTAVDGHDGYYYAYCLRNRDHGNIVARAPTDHPGPGNWKKYFRPKEFPGMWPGPPLSALDPGRSAQYFQELMSKLDATGVTLAGLELENDAYNLHTYPWGDHPGDKASAIHRMRRPRALVDPICVPGGKPCWITEWGFAYAGNTCSASEEKDRALVVQEMMGDFAELAREGRLTGLIYYSWTGDVQFDVERCGGLTESGKRALSPL